MDLLIITRKVDITDDRMGWFVGWINEFARHVRTLQVISMQPGSVKGLADNVRVEFVQKKSRHANSKNTPIGKLLMYVKYRKLLKQLVPGVDGVFVHMMPLYSNIAGPIVKKHHKKLLHWYMHKSVDAQLIKSQKWVDEYITASRESFRMQTDKPVRIVGHGIPVEKIKFHQAKLHGNDTLNILTVGRISPSKGLETLIKAVHLLITSYKLQVKVHVVGAPALDSDNVYLEELKQIIRKYGLENDIIFTGPKPNSDVIEMLPKYDIFINCSSTGSADKAVLEPMASGMVVFTSNEAFKPIIGGLSQLLMFVPNDANELAQKIVSMIKLPEQEIQHIQSELRQIVKSHHNLPITIEKIVRLYR